MVHFILYSRSYCHLCDDMLAALENLRAEFDFSVEVIDVDADAALVERYDELVPVLVGQRVGDQRAHALHRAYHEPVRRGTYAALGFSARCRSART